MTAYARVGLLQLYVTPNSQAVTPFSPECDFQLAAIFDITHLLSGTREVLKSINNVNTYIHPIKFQLQANGTRRYEASSDDHKSQVFGFSQQTMDSKNGLVIPCLVSVPRSIWPPRAGDAVQFRIRGTARVDFIHCDEGNRLESVVREAETMHTVYCRASS